MTISRDTFDALKRYRKIKFHQDRDLLDSELNEVQAIISLRNKLIADVILRDGAILEGLDVSVVDNVVTINSGKIYIYGSVEEVPGTILTFDPAKATGVDVIYAELLRETIGVNQDSSLINIYTGEPTAEREKWTVTLKASDTTGDTLPAGALGRLVIPLFIFNRETGEVQRVIIERSNLRLRDCQGTLDGSRIALASITEDQLGFAAAEGLTSLLQNLAERTFDESGSYVVNGLDSFLGAVNSDSVEVITNPGRAYIRGYRLQVDLPVVHSVPISRETRQVDDELKFFKKNPTTPAEQFYWLNSRPVKDISNLKINVETTGSITKGAPGGADLLPHTPVVEIVEVHQGQTYYQLGVDYVQNGNSIDWLGASEPASGSTYTATWRYTRILKGQKLTTLSTGINATATEITVEDAGHESGDVLLIELEAVRVINADGQILTVTRGQESTNAIPHPSGTTVMRFVPDFILGGGFGQFHPQFVASPGLYYYFLTAEDNSGETAFIPSKVKSIQTLVAGLNKITWSAVSGATKYNIYRSTNGTNRESFCLLQSINVSEPRYFYDFGQQSYGDNLNRHPPVSNESSGLMTPNFDAVDENNDCLFFIPDDMHEDYALVDNSPIIIDYEYYFARRDLLYATTREINLASGQSSENPNIPLAPDGTLSLAEIYAPPNSADLQLRNLSLTRVTMEMIHRMMRDIEDLKYNDALNQMNQDLEGRDTTPKKGIYSDDFSSDVQSDVNHPDWDARIDTIQRFVAPPRIALGHILQPDLVGSNVLFMANIALLQIVENVLIAQEDFSESRNVTPSNMQFHEALVEVSPRVVRPGQQIHVRASGLTPNADNIYICIARQLVANNLSADAQGRLDVTFSIPAQGLSYGDRSLEVYDSETTITTSIRVAFGEEISRRESLVVDWSVNNPDLLPSAPKINRKPAISQTQPTSQGQAVCNMAQTFLMTEDSLVSAVGLFFSAKDSALPVTVKICPVVNGMPTSENLAFRTLAPSEILRDTETKITFPNSILLKADTVYAAVLSTASTQYQVRTATLGQQGQNGLITGQAYDRGNLLIGTSNPNFIESAAWSAEPNTDLTMKIYGFGFASDGVLKFQKLTGVQISSLALDTYSLLPENTSLLWEISTDNGLTWQPITPEFEEDLSIIATTVWVRANLSTTNGYLSPIIAHRAVNLISYRVAGSGTYITRMLETSEGISSCKVYAQMRIPSGCSVTWFASSDNGENWVELDLEDVRTINTVWTEYQFAGDFPQNTGRFIRFKAEMTSNGALYPKIHRLGATLS